MVVLNITKRINGSDLDIRAHKFQKFWTNGSCFLINILRSVINQRFKFNLIAVFGVLNIFNGSYLDLLYQDLRKKKKKKNGHIQNHISTSISDQSYWTIIMFSSFYRELDKTRGWNFQSYSFSVFQRGLTVWIMLMGPNNF